MLEVWQTYEQGQASGFQMSPWYCKVNACKWYGFLCAKAFMYHLVGNTMQTLVARLKSTRYSDRIISSVLERGFSEKEEKKMFWEQEKGREKLAVIPFFHASANNRQALAKPCGVRVAIKNDFKLPRLSRFRGGKGAACTVKHRQMAGDCVTGVAHWIPLKSECC